LLIIPPNNIVAIYLSYDNASWRDEFLFKTASVNKQFDLVRLERDVESLERQQMDIRMQHMEQFICNEISYRRLRNAISGAYSDFTFGWGVGPSSATIIPKIME
jgi:hypothetical protein